jgi:glycosyltransferase involved in cell wall biosynthesis
MLEALSCGSNILVASDKSFEETYLPLNFINVISTNEDLVVNKIKEMLLACDKTETFYTQMHEFCRNSYSWHIIGKETFKILENT